MSKHARPKHRQHFEFWGWDKDLEGRPDIKSSGESNMVLVEDRAGVKKYVHKSELPPLVLDDCYKPELIKPLKEWDTESNPVKDLMSVKKDLIKQGYFKEG